MPIRSILCLLACALMLRGVAADQSSHLLDGVTCTVQMSQDGKPKDKDTLVFANGTGSSPGIAKAYAFAPAPYTATRKGADAAFAFTVTSAEHGKVEFKGVISGDQVTGTRTWSKPDKEPIVFNFTGTAGKK